MFMKKSKIALAVAAAAGLTFSSGAFATNGIVQAGNGMAAHGLGGAGLSNANEAMSGFDNPALVTQTGNSISVAFSIFSPDREVDTSGVAALPGAFKGLTVSDSKTFAIPQIAFTSKISDSLSWGIMVNALGGMNTDYRTGAAGNPMMGITLADTEPEYVNLQGILVAPTLAYAVNKNLSVGVSLLLGHTTLTTRNLFAQGAAGTNEGSATGYGIKLGADWKVTDSLSLGAILQPKLEVDEISYFKTFLTGFGFTGDAQLTLPNEVGVGGKYKIGKNLDIVADVLYYQWTSVDVFEFFGWDDQVVFKVGAEFRPSDKWALRVGYNYGESPIKGGNKTQGPSQDDAAFANYPFPAISEHHVTFGLGYNMDKNMAINAYYLYSPEATETATTASRGGTFPAGTEIRMTQHAFGIGINYQTN